MRVRCIVYMQINSSRARDHLAPKAADEWNVGAVCFQESYMLDMYVITIKCLGLVAGYAHMDLTIQWSFVQLYNGMRVVVVIVRTCEQFAAVLLRINNLESHSCLSVFY